MFFWANWKTNMTTLASSREIFHFFSLTAEQNLTKLERKEVLKIFYQIFGFRLIEKQRWLPWSLTLFLAETFSTSPLQPLNRIWWNLTGSKNSTSSTKFVLLFLWNGKTIMATMASDLLRHFRIFFCNRWMEFEETCLEASPCCPLPCFFVAWYLNSGG